MQHPAIYPFKNHKEAHHIYSKCKPLDFRDAKNCIIYIYTSYISYGMLPSKQINFFLEEKRSLGGSGTGTRGGVLGDGIAGTGVISNRDGVCAGTSPFSKTKLESGPTLSSSACESNSSVKHLRTVSGALVGVGAVSLLIAFCSLVREV